jgi:hypothetical protein
MTVPTCQQLAAALERAARIAAPCIAYLFTAALLLADLAYRLGYLTGQAVHARSQQLARLAPQVPSQVPSQLPSQKWEAMGSTTAQPLLHPASLLAADLERLTTRQLRQLTGIRRKLSKRQLIAYAIAL